LEIDMKSHRFVKTPEAAEFVRLSTSQLNKLRVFGNGPEFVKLGRSVLYEVEALESWIAKNRRSSTSQSAA
jgi:predicted DNA-binding transcriptional regulator AlpA